ncbi:ABC transporter [Platysternon megacephalum]|uniref:ABC transporter n=1 Tax=Platysternon megacephalum TaxID=55544 RepID=A0A4D9DG39_9SAUR|nr:ABC transporter [Platysternon megacephalum]
MSFNGPQTGAQGSLPCGVKCSEPYIVTVNEPCVVKCKDSQVIIYPPPVVVTFPGPILTTCPQESIVASSGPPDTGMAESAARISAAPGVTGSLGPHLDRCPPSINIRHEPQYTPKYSYAYSSRWSHPGKSLETTGHSQTTRNINRTK